MSAVSVHTIPVELYCPATNHSQKRQACNISLNELFILGNPCPQPGAVFDIVISSARQKTPLRLSTCVARPGKDGFTLCYSCHSEQDRQALENIISPHWDGHNLLDGLLIFSAYEHVEDLAGYLRLTTLIDRHQQTLCTHHPARKKP